MSDEEMIEFLGLRRDCQDEANLLRAVRSIAPEKRTLFERMAIVAMEAELWVAGLGPKPAGALIDLDKGARR